MLFFNNIITNAVKNFQCPICNTKFIFDKLLYLHIEKEHGDEIPEDVTPKQYAFNKRRNKEYQLCTICGINHTKWCEESGRYSLVCEDPVCKQTARNRFLKNYKKKYGKDHSINDPEVQKQMMYAKKNSGEYTFLDGGKIRYASGYELDFLKLLNEDLHLPSDSDTIRECDIYFEYMYEDKNHYYIPDYYMKIYDLIIEIKSDDNSHPKIQAVDKITEELKDKAVKKDGSHNFIKIVDKQYDQFLELLEVLRNEHLNNSSYTKYCIIPEYKPPKNLKSMPDLHFLKDESLFKNKSILKIYDIIKQSTKEQTIPFNLILNKNYILKQYITKEDEELFALNKIILRTTNVDPNNTQKVKQCFNEFDKYVTLKYAKFLNQDFMSTCFDCTKSNILPVYLVNTPTKEKEKILDTFLKMMSKVFHQYVTLTIKNGYLILFHYNIRQTLKNTLIQLTQIEKLMKELYKNDYVLYDGNDTLIPIPGTLDGNTLVTIADEYTTL